MGGFFSAMFTEMGARRRRLRGALGDRGQGLAEFMILGGLAVGSLGLFARPWMAGAAPWGFTVPLVFLLGYFLIEARRQAALAREGAEAEPIGTGYDWTALLWSLGCALAGAAAFTIAWSAEPPSTEEEIWTPPTGSVVIEITP